MANQLQSYFYTLILLFILFIFSRTQAQSYNVICSGLYLKSWCQEGVLVFTNAFYGSVPNRRTVCGTARAASHCSTYFVEDILNNPCFGKVQCIIDVSDRTMGSPCADRNNALFHRGFCTAANTTHRLCETSSISEGSGYVFGFYKNGGCDLTFNISSSDRVNLTFVYYRLKASVIACENVLFFTLNPTRRTGVQCRDVTEKLSQSSGETFSGPNFRLEVEAPALGAGFGFLLKYIVIHGPGVNVLPTPPVQATEVTILETASPGPSDNNSTSVTLFHPGITRYAHSDATMPGELKKMNSTIIIIVISLIILIAVITTSIVVFFIVRRLRKKAEHKADVAHAVRALSYRPSLEGNRYDIQPSLSEPPSGTEGGIAPVESDGYSTVLERHPSGVIIVDNALYAPDSGAETGAGTGYMNGNPVGMESVAPPDAGLYSNREFSTGPPVDRSTRPDLADTTTHLYSIPGTLDMPAADMGDTTDEMDGAPSLNTIMATLSLSNDIYTGISPMDTAYPLWNNTNTFNHV